MNAKKQNSPRRKTGHGQLGRAFFLYLHSSGIARAITAFSSCAALHAAHKIGVLRPHQGLAATASRPAANSGMHGREDDMSATISTRHDVANIKCSVASDPMLFLTTLYGGTVKRSGCNAWRVGNKGGRCFDTSKGELLCVTFNGDPGQGDCFEVWKSHHQCDFIAAFNRAMAEHWDEFYRDWDEHRRIVGVDSFDYEQGYEVPKSLTPKAQLICGPCST